MNNLILMDELSRVYMVEWEETEEEMPLKDVRIFSSTQQNVRTNRVFLTNDAALFAGTDPFENILILVSGESAPTGQISKTKWILHTDSSLASVQECIADILEAYADWERECFAALTEGIAIEDYMKVLSGRMRNPIALFDASLVLISFAGSFAGDTRGTVWEKVIDLQYTPMELFSKVEQEELSRSLATNTRWITIAPAFDKRHLHLCVPVRYEGRLLGMLGMIDLNEKITAGQRSMALLISGFVGKYFRSGSEHLSASRNVHYYIIRLLQGLDIDIRVLEHYLAGRGWHVEGKYLLANFPIAHRDDPLVTQSQLVRIERRFPKAMVFLHESSVVVVSNCPEIAAYDAFFRDAEGFAHEASLLCGMSDRFYSFTHLKYAYIQSKIALNYVSEAERIVPFRANYIDYSIASLGNSISLKAMCHPAVLKLAESGSEQNLILINNLKTYLLYGCNIQDTANALFIHRNTLVYRLEKMNHLLCADVRSLTENDRFYLLMSCIICEKITNNLEIQR